MSLKTSHKTCLRPNKDRGSYIDSDHYLDVHFRLLREDFVAPLREGVQQIIKSKSLSHKGQVSVQAYEPVHGAGVEVRYGVQHTWLKLPEVVQKRVKWDRSKRLLKGNLILLTSDRFAQTVAFGTVSIRDVETLRNDGLIAVTIETVDSTFFPEEGGSYLLLESEVYFEAYRHILKCLQRLELNEFPLAKYIVNAQGFSEPPQYLAKLFDEEQLEPDEEIVHAMTIPLFRGAERKAVIDPLNDGWPTPRQLGLDENQFLAFKAALTHQFCIIQGPPGTGKTYLGLRVAEALLENKNLWMSENSGPLLIVCYTNHALDQFLEGVLDIFKALSKVPSIVRVGGRCGSERLQQYELFKIRYASRFAYVDPILDNNREVLRNYKSNMDSAEYQYKEVTRILTSLQTPDGLINFQNLSLWEELSAFYPAQLWIDLSDPSFLGFSDEFLAKKNFVASSAADAWFGPVIQNAEKRPASHHSKGTPTGSQADNEKDEGEEDYDMNELLQGRLFEEEFHTEPLNRHQSPQPSSSNFKESYKKETYLKGISLSNCTCQIDKRQEALSNLRQRAEDFLLLQKCTAAELEKVRTDIENELLLWKNRRQLLLEIIRRYKFGRFSESKERFLASEAVELAWTGIQDRKSGAPASFTTILPNLSTRWSLYFMILEHAASLLAPEKARLAEELLHTKKVHDEVVSFIDGRILRRSSVVGMTTTGAAKYYDAIRDLSNKIVIVEEAAEVLESHIVTCLTKSCEHAILIGDHKQLKPSTTVYDLKIKYGLDVSLFERMINNNLHFYPLTVQHRMRPEIADLVRGSIYEDLIDHESVSRRNNVPVLTRNLFFLTHTEPENSENDSKSRWNEFESDYLLGLCRHLVLQGNKQETITVLTTYTGQMFKLKKKFRNGPYQDILGQVRITCVDNFQGEENSIILLSLVRSNEEGMIGFLKEPNRVCVALSRARDGFYIVGNMKTLTAWEPNKKKDQGYRGIWTIIKNKLENTNPSGIGLELSIVCQRHPESISNVRTLSDFLKKSPEGGCDLVCNVGLSCGHSCPRLCHLNDLDHSLFVCEMPCLKKCGEEEAHPCMELCYQPCKPCRYIITISLECGHKTVIQCHARRVIPKCLTLVDKELDCGHKAENIACYKKSSEICCEVLVKKFPLCNQHETDMACFIEPAKYQCRIEVSKLLPCGHSKVMQCFVDINEVKCKQRVMKKLPCGHEEEDECHLAEENVKCQHKTEKLFKICGHSKIVSCWQKESPKLLCDQKCDSRLECGHSCRKTCHLNDDPDHIQYECRKQCVRSCELGHPCPVPHECSRPCPICKILTHKKLPCSHTAQLQCGIKVKHFQNCKEKCERTLACGHSCEALCKDKCGTCNVPTSKRIDECGHSVTIPCSEKPLRQICKEETTMIGISPCGHDVQVPCKLVAKMEPADIQRYCQNKCDHEFQIEDGGCGHKCAGNCGACLGGRLHLKCQNKCGKVLVCGHVCEFPCTTDCPPCGKPCFLRCEHSNCKKPCGFPCTMCKEKCTWNCPHYSCTKKCGEPCNRPPCNEPCPKPLPCGHECIGFCGEPCPPLCRKCDKDKEEMKICPLTFIEYEPDSRFVYLPDCKHTIWVETLLAHLTVKVTEAEEAENGGEPHEVIRAKTCPICQPQTVIRSCRRFRSIILNTLEDIRAVNQKLLQNRKELLKLQKSMIVELTMLLHEDYAPKTLLGMMLDKIANKREATRGPSIWMPKPIVGLELDSLQFIVQIIREVLVTVHKRNVNRRSLHTGKSPSIEQLENFLSGLFKLQHSFPLSKVQERDLEMECARLVHLAEYERFQPYKLRADVKKALIQAETHLQAYRPYTKEMQELGRSYLLILEELCRTGLGISEAERIEITRALGMRQGHWFKCPNGHIYAIGDCGGAMELSKCNECHESIGGAQHKLTTGNSLAPEMDRASAPAWPQPQLQQNLWDLI